MSQSETEPSWAESLWLLSTSFVFSPLAPRWLKQTTQFSLKSQLSANSANHEHDPVLRIRARMPLGTWRELLAWGRKAPADLSLKHHDLQHCKQGQTLAPAARRLPEQHAWAVLRSEQLQASSTQQMNYHQSKCYLTRFILCVFLLHSHHTKHSKKNIV